MNAGYLLIPRVLNCVVLVFLAGTITGSVIDMSNLILYVTELSNNREGQLVVNEKVRTN